MWCPLFTHISDFGIINWKTTKAGNTIPENCPSGPNGAKAYRKCNDDGEWGKADFCECGTAQNVNGNLNNMKV